MGARALVLVVLAALGVAAPAAVSCLLPAGGTATTAKSQINRPGAIVTGPGGALWFTNMDSIGRITTRGAVTLFTHPGMTMSSIGAPAGITAGPDGALWFPMFVEVTDGYGGAIGRITTQGAVRIYRKPGITVPTGITTGRDGAVWFTNDPADDYGSIGRITTSGAVTTYGMKDKLHPREITVGPDKALWFTDDLGVGRMSTRGAGAIFKACFRPSGIAVGSDGALWFTCPPPPMLAMREVAPGNWIGRITTGGGVRIYRKPGIKDPVGITAGPDGALWFTNSDSIGRITTKGAVTIYRKPGINYASGITAGPDGALWFTDTGSNTIGRITIKGAVTFYSGGKATPTPAPTPPPTPTPQPPSQLGTRR